MYKDLFYGNWRTSYGDTITFSKQGNKNMLRYTRSTNPSSPDTTIEFIFNNGKLGIKDGVNPTGQFRMLQTFFWSDEGRVYSVLSNEWFPFLSSSTLYYSFVRLP